MVQFIQANWKEIALLGYVLIDAIIYFVPSLKGNGLLNQLEIWLKGQSQPPSQPPNA